METILKKNPVIAILRNVPDQDFADYMQSLYDGGLRAFEISFSHPGAAEQIRKARTFLPSDALIGAGTVLTPAEVHLAAEAGADFLLSPSANPEVLSCCAKEKQKLLPGALTPTDVSVCLAHGFSTIKLFPAGDMPLGYRKSLNGPFPHANFVAVGGVTPGNAADYFRAGYIGAGIGSSLVDQTLFASKNWSAITASIKNFLNSLRKENLI